MADAGADQHRDAEVGGSSLQRSQAHVAHLAGGIGPHIAVGRAGGQRRRVIGGHEQFGKHHQGGTVPGGTLGEACRGRDVRGDVAGCRGGLHRGHPQRLLRRLTQHQDAPPPAGSSRLIRYIVRSNRSAAVRTGNLAGARMPAGTATGASTVHGAGWQNWTIDSRASCWPSTAATRWKTAGTAPPVSRSSTMPVTMTAYPSGGVSRCHSPPASTSRPALVARGNAVMRSKSWCSTAHTWPSVGACAIGGYQAARLTMGPSESISLKNPGPIYSASTIRTVTQSWNSA